jgi:hypothetical protein
MLANKVAVAQYITETLLVNTTDLTKLGSYIASVTEVAATVDAAKLAAQGANGQTFTLTTGVDSINITTANTVDTVNGVVDGTTPANGTFSAGDTIDGNGKTILRLVVADDGNAPFTTLKDIDQVNVIAGVTGTLNVNAFDWSNIGSVNLAGGTGLEVNVNNLADGVDLSVRAGAAGELNATYNSGLEVFLEADRNSAVSYVDGVVAATIASNDDVTVTVEHTDSSDISVGNVTVTGGDNADFEFYVGANGSGDIAVGDITLSGEGDSDVTITLGYAQSGDLTVGNISIVSGDGDVDVDLGEDGDNGDVTVGDVSIEVTGIGSISFDIGYAGAIGGNATVGDMSFMLGSGSLDVNVDAEGDVSVGNLTVVGGESSDLELTFEGLGGGSVSVGAVDMEVGVSGSLDLTIRNSYFASTTEASLGSLTVGDMSFAIAGDADGSVYIQQRLDNLSTGDVGAVTIGDINATLGIGAGFALTLSVTNSADVNGTIGDIQVGNVTMTGDDGAWAEFYVDVFGEGDGSADVVDMGDITIGNVSMVVADTGEVDFDVDISASYGSIGAISLGDVTLSVGKSGDLSGSIEVDAWGDIESFTVGDISLSLGESATGDFYINVNAYTNTGSDGNLGAVVLGDLTANLAANATLTDFDIYIEAENNIASVAMGNVTINAGDSAAVDLYVGISSTSGGDVGDVEIRNVNLTAAQAAVIDAGFYINATSGDVGDVTFGDISLVATDGSSADIDLYITVSASGDVGTLTLGNITVNANDDASNVYIDLNTPGNLVIGDITVLGSYTALSTIGGWLDTAGVAGDITIGNVDYSGFLAAASIDVSGFLGAGEIIGTAFGDTITDNEGTNVITGGAGADTFVFVNTNANIVLADLDVITDWGNGADLLDVDVAVTAGNYFEGTYASFDAFMTAAATRVTGGDAVVVGRVGSDLFVAVDFDANSGTLDTVIQLAGVSDLGLIGTASFV